MSTYLAFYVHPSSFYIYISSFLFPFLFIFAIPSVSLSHQITQQSHTHMNTQPHNHKLTHSQAANPTRTLTGTHNRAHARTGTQSQTHTLTGTNNYTHAQTHDTGGYHDCSSCAAIIPAGRKQLVCRGASALEGSRRAPRVSGQRRTFMVMLHSTWSQRSHNALIKIRVP